LLVVSFLAGRAYGRAYGTTLCLYAVCPWRMYCG